MKARDVITKRIKDKIAKNQDKPDIVKECKHELELIAKDGPTHKRVQGIIFNQNSKTLCNVDSDEEEHDYNISYWETDEILEKWAAIRMKYAPETNSFAKVDAFKALTN